MYIDISGLITIGIEAKPRKYKIIIKCSSKFTRVKCTVPEPASPPVPPVEEALPVLLGPLGPPPDPPLEKCESLLSDLLSSEFSELVLYLVGLEGSEFALRKLGATVGKPSIGSAIELRLDEGVIHSKL